MPQVKPALARIEKTFGKIERGRLAHELVRRLISVFVEDLLRQSLANLQALGAVHPNDIRYATSAVIAFSPKMTTDLELLRNFLFTNMWRHFKVNRMTSKAKRVVTELFNLFMSETNTLPEEWQHHENQPIASLPDETKARIISDYIASMTDRYAALEHERLFDLRAILR